MIGNDDASVANDFDTCFGDFGSFIETIPQHLQISVLDLQDLPIFWTICSLGIEFSLTWIMLNSNNQLSLELGMQKVGICLMFAMDVVHRWFKYSKLSTYGQLIELHKCFVYLVSDTMWPQLLPKMLPEMDWAREANLCKMPSHNSSQNGKSTPH